MERYRRLFVGFFALMLLLTSVSRAADSVSVAQVTTAQATGGTLSYFASAEGRVTALDQEYVNGGSGLLLREVCASAGQKVDAGDPLFCVDAKEAEKRLAQVQRQLAELELTMQQAEISTGVTSSEQAVCEARRRLQRAQEDDAFNRSINGGISLQSDLREIEDAGAQLAQAERQLAQARELSGIQQGLTALSMEEKREEEAQLSAICESGGIIASPVSGFVGTIQAQAGKNAPADWLCTILPDDGRLLVEADFTAEEAKYIRVGDTVSAVPAGKQLPIEGLRVQSVQQVYGTGEPSEEAVRVTVLLPEENRLACGSPVTISHTFATDRYDVTIPLSALRGGASQYYVLVAEDSDSILGTVRRAVRVDVTLLAQDGTKAAIQEGLSEAVIAQSNKPVQAGDRIREVSLL